MFDSPFFHSELFNWVFLPMLIFVSRMTDVTLGTLRHIFISKGFRKIVPFLGFFEVLIWLVVISQIMKNLNNFLCYFAWAGGFATGTLIGMMIEERLALGLQVCRIITHEDCKELIGELQKSNVGITIIDGQGVMGPVKIILTVIERKNVEAGIGIIHQFNPNACYSIEDVREANKGVFKSRMGAEVSK